MRYLSCFLFCALSTNVLFSQPGSDLRKTGVKQLQQELYLQALNTFNDALRQEPNASDLYFFRGFAKYGLDDFIGAEKDYSRSLELFSYQPDVYINRAIVRSQQKNFTGAFEDFASALEMDSTNAAIFINRARINLYTRNFDACINDCYRALDLEKESDELVYLLKGSAEMGLGNQYTAITSFHKAIEVNPENPFGPIQLGAAWMELEHFDSAMACFGQALKLDPNNIYALFNQALIKVNTKDTEGALADLNRIITLSPYNSYAYFNRAIVLSEMKDKEAAIRDLSAVINLNPNNLISYYYRGLLKTEINNLQGAVEDFTKTVELFPDYADGYMARSGVKEKMKDQKGAARDHQLGMEAMKRNKNRPDTLAFDEKNYLENLIKLSGNFEEMNTMSSKFQNQYVDIQLAPVFHLFFGRARYDQIELYDSYPKEHYYTSIISLANIPSLVSDSARRANVVRQSVLLDSVSRNPESYLIRAVSYVGLEEFEKAIADCDSALQLDPEFGLLYFTRGNARYGMYQYRQKELEAGSLPGIVPPPVEEKDSALLAEDSRILDLMFRDFEKVIGLDPDFPFVYYNRGNVHADMGNYQEALYDFRRAVDRKTNLAEGSYNLGPTHLLLKDTKRGCNHLSQAGELGIADAYKVMKRFCYE